MKKLAHLAMLGAMTLAAGAGVAEAQNIAVQKDYSRSTVSSMTTDSFGDIEFRGPLGYTLRPGAPVYCNSGDREEVAKIAIERNLYTARMISPEQAKAVALCAVPGQISSGEMENRDGRVVYSITLLPTDKKVHAKVDVDAHTGEVINAKEFGGLRGLAGFLRESAARERNERP